MMSDPDLQVGVDRELPLPEELTPLQKDLADVLWQVGAFQFGDFKLRLHDDNPEAPLSPVYIDLRILRRYPELKGMVTDAYVKLLADSGIEFSHLADVPTAATPLVSSISDRMNVGMITPRMDKKAHGTGAPVDGLYEGESGIVAVLVDDLITNARSKRKSAQRLRDNGVEVNDVVVLIDREQGGREGLADHDLTLHSVLTLYQMLSYYMEAGYITDDELFDATQRIAELNMHMGV